MPDPAFAPAYFETFARDVLAPAATRARCPLRAEAFQCREPVSWDEARRARYAPVREGWTWGPAWSTCWFRLRGSVPAALARARAGATAALRFSSDTEALLYAEGVPHQGLDAHRDEAVLSPAQARGLRAGAGVEFFVEAACNHPFGVEPLQWDGPDTAFRWRSARPGRFLYAELVLRDEVVWRLHRAFLFAAQLARLLTPPPPPMHAVNQPWSAEPAPWQDARAEELLAALRRAARLISPRDVAAGAPEALALLHAAIGREPGASASVCHAVGHAHIDTAWLWPLRQTRRKCLRTFSSVLRLMERDERFVFLCSQAQQYAMVERDAPALFRQIARRVREGRWEPGGAMWVEPDVHAVSGESLIRQIVHGCGYWSDRFGPAGRQSFLFLPDTFGFSAALPQIMKLAGLGTFITNKLSWNQTNPFPHTTFVWRGLGGHEVLAHCTPGGDYNAAIAPLDLRRGDRQHRTKQIPSVESLPDLRPRGPRWLQPFGFGDGGGGPTEWMLENASLARACDGLPRVEPTRADEFCRALAFDVAAAEARGDAPPVWEGELYLELHRGTLTTHAALKRSNLLLEDALRLAEALECSTPPEAESVRGGGGGGGGRGRAGASAGTGAGTGAGADAARRAALDESWKLLLLNQFHDILPGSSIPEVYAEARQQHARVRAVADEIIHDGLERLAARADPGDAREPWLIFNPTSSPASGLVALTGDGAGAARRGGGRRSASARLAKAALVPAMGFLVIDARKPVDEQHLRPATVRVDARARRAVIENGWIRAEVDGLGRVTSLRCLHHDERAPTNELLAGPANQLVLYDDLPRMWDAWDIDPEHTLHARAQDAPADRWGVAARGPLRAALRVERPLGAASRVTQTITLDSDSPRLDIVTRVDWREDRRLLRALFPLDLRAEHATFQTHLGHLRRPLHRNTSREQAAFEVPVGRWLDVSDRHGGVAVLNQSQFGASAWSLGQAGALCGLSLLRSPRYPDPTADRGVHEFTYSLLPHAGDWRKAAVEHQAELLHRPLLARPMAGSGRRSAAPPSLGRHYAPIIVYPDFASGSDPEMTIAALKPAEDGRGVILRLAEVHGVDGLVRVEWARPLASLAACDLLERPLEHPGLSLARDRRGVSVATFPVRPFQIVTLRAVYGR